MTNPSRPKIADLIVHDPDDAETLSRDALHFINHLLVEVVVPWDDVEDALKHHSELMDRFEALFGCFECGIHDGHKLDCSKG